MKEIKLFTYEGKQVTLTEEQFEKLPYSTESYLYFGCQMPRNMNATQKAAWAKERYFKLANMAKSFANAFHYAKKKEEEHGGLKTLFDSVAELS